MTYESALDYAIEHLPMQNYDDFDSWYNGIEGLMNTPSLTDNDEFYNMANEQWIDRMGEDIESGAIIDEEPSRKEEIKIESGAVITRDGVRPVEVVSADIPQTPISENIIIEKSGSTAQRRGLIESIKSAISGFAKRFKR